MNVRVSSECEFKKRASVTVSVRVGVMCEHRCAYAYAYKRKCESGSAKRSTSVRMNV